MTPTDTIAALLYPYQPPNPTQPTQTHDNRTPRDRIRIRAQEILPCSWCGDPVKEKESKPHSLILISSSFV